MAKSGTNMKHRIIQLSGLLAIALLVVGAVASRNLYHAGVEEPLSMKSILALLSLLALNAHGNAL
jgi:hypothetical protein